MAEYIKREAAIKAIYDSEPFGVHKYFWWRAMDIEEALRAIPAVDVAPVVRCKDCKHHYDCGINFCDRLGMDCPDDSDFSCSYGESKDGGVE